MTLQEVLPKYTEYLPMVVQGFVATFLLTPLVGSLARKLNVLDKPPSARDARDPERHRRLEKAPRPLWGGVAVLLPFLILNFLHQELTLPMIGFLVGVTALLILGILDDIVRLSWKVQLSSQIIVIFLTIVFGIGLSVINNPFNGSLELNLVEIPVRLGEYTFSIQILGHVIYMAWVILCINAVKWTAGTDGVMEGIVTIAAVIFFLVGVRGYEDTVAHASAMLMGSMTAFMIFNFYPSKIFSGSSGKSVYGFLLSVLAVLSRAKVAVAVLVLALPLVDMIWVMLKRITSAGAKTPVKMIKAAQRGDNTHFHHELLKMGFTERQVAYVEYLITASLGALALAVTGALKTVILFVALAVVILVVIMATVVNKRREKKTKSKPGIKGKKA